MLQREAQGDAQFVGVCWGEFGGIVLHGGTLSQMWELIKN
jgi:hypothetical protein